MNDIQSIKNVFPTQTLTTINTEIAQSKWSYGWRSSFNVGYGHWNIDFTDAIIENGLDVSDKLPPELYQAWQHLQSTFLPDHRLVRCYTNGHTYGIEGYSHRDSNRSGEKTLVVYLNQSWNRDWGGETLIYDNDDIIHAEIPKYNTGLLFPGNLYHVARGVTRVCPELRMTLMFKVTPLTVVDSLRDKLQNFLQTHSANQVSHSTTSLCGHLLRTYDLLKKAKQSSDVCVAGALHSVFGTSVFKHRLIDLTEKDLLINEFGDYPIYLVELFSKLARPASLEMSLDLNKTKLLMTNGTEVEVTSQELSDLLVIEAANLQDQHELHKMPNLHKYWQQLNTV